MKTNFRLLALAVIAAIFSVQCSEPGEETTYPTTIEDNFSVGRYAYEDIQLNYRECHIGESSSAKSPLVIVLHSKAANGSDNSAHLRQDAMIRIWHHFSSNNIRATILAPQCSARRDWNEIMEKADETSMSQCLKAWIDDYTKRHSYVNTSRIYLLGYSSGGEGVWRMLSDYPSTFAAAMTVAAEADGTIVPANVAQTPVLSVRGGSDVHAVSLNIETFVGQVVDAGGTIIEQIMQGMTHDEICREAFTAENLDWILTFNK